MHRLSVLKLSLLLMIIAIGVGLSGCSILIPPPSPTIQPAELTVAPLPTTAIVSDDGVVGDSRVVPVGRDPDIVTLLNNVSEQQLIAYIQQLQDFGTRNSYSDTQREDFGIGASRRWIFSEFERVGNGRLQVRFQDFPLTVPEAPTTTQRNVVATLPGVSNYAGTVVIGAHYDSRVGSPTDGTSLSPSANDNASGVAMMLELARLLSSRTWNQTIIFVAFAAEEQGTAGSRYFVNNTFIEGTQVDWAVSNDGVGGRVGIPQTVRMFAPNQATSASGPITRYMNYINTLYQPDFPLTIINALDREGRYGDHREFINAGIGAVRLIESQEDSSLLNSTRDTWDKIDYSYLASVTRVNLAAIANWAGAPPPPNRPTISGMADAGSYLVTWQTDPQAASYVVAFRPLDSLEYPEFRYVSAIEAGQKIFTDLDPQGTYAVSIAPVSASGRMGGFSAEIIIP